LFDRLNFLLWVKFSVGLSLTLNIATFQPDTVPKFIMNYLLKREYVFYKIIIIYRVKEVPGEILEFIDIFPKDFFLSWYYRKL